MALESAIYSQDQFGYAPLFKDYYGFQDDEQEEGASTALFHGTSNYWDCCYYNNNNNNNNNNIHHQHSTSSPSDPCTGTGAFSQLAPPPPQEEEAVAVESTSVVAPRRKRQRTKNTKNREEIENQRMTHIAVERNRRKQMNEYLALLRSLMPPSYVQRGDQASIVGGAINFVKELEQLLQTMEAHKTAQQQHGQNDNADDGDDQAEECLLSSSSSQLFAEFFAFPQFSTRPGARNAETAAVTQSTGGENLGVAAGEIEVTMVESHANVKILARKHGRQLLKLVAGLQSLRATILHLNVTTTSDQMVLYSISIKVEEGCNLNTVDEIAAAVNQMLRQIEEGSC